MIRAIFSSSSLPSRISKSTFQKRLISSGSIPRTSFGRFTRHEIQATQRTIATKTTRPASGEMTVPPLLQTSSATSWILGLLFLIPSLYVSKTVVSLTRTYPTNPGLELPPTHPAFTSPDNSALKQAHIEYWEGRVPISSLQASPDSQLAATDEGKTSLIREFTAALFQTRSLTLEAKFIGWGMGNGFQPGDRGENGVQEGHDFAHGLFKVTHLNDKEGWAVVAYPIPDHVVRSFETMAKWGLPWRHLSGGRHVFQVIPDKNSTDKQEDGEKWATVRFGCVVDIERKNRLTGERDGKGLPSALLWFHQMYARRLLDEAIQDLKRKAGVR